MALSLTVLSKNTQTSTCFQLGKQRRSAQSKSTMKNSTLSGEGDRVGLALKNIDVEDLDRGAVLTNDPSIKTGTTLKATAQLVKYWPSPLKQGMVMHVGHWTQFVTAKSGSCL